MTEESVGDMPGWEAMELINYKYIFCECNKDLVGVDYNPDEHGMSYFVLDVLRLSTQGYSEVDEESYTIEDDLGASVRKREAKKSIYRCRKCGYKFDGVERIIEESVEFKDQDE